MTNPKPKPTRAKTSKRFVLRVTVEAKAAGTRSEARAAMQKWLDDTRYSRIGVKSARVTNADIP